MSAPLDQEEITNSVECSLGVDITPKHDGGVLKEILTPGTGEDHPLKGDTVYFHYVGKLTDGTKFDSSRDRKDKHQFIIGDGSVIKAWDIGVATMRRGELAVFHCQPEYAHGKKGSPPKIPPDAALTYEIELFSWRGEDVSANKDGGVLKSKIKEGEGVNPPKDGAVCTIHLIGKHNGRQFVDRDVKFTLGEGTEVDIVEGVEQGLKTFKAEERALLKVKARYAYGTEGHEKQDIPPDADLEFDVHLKSYDPFKEGWMMDDDEKLSNAERMKLKGTYYFQAGKFKFAAKYYSRIIEFLLEEDMLRGEEAKRRNNLMLAAHLNMAACHLKLGNNLDATHCCDEALKMEPKSEKALYRRATANMNMQHYENAIEDYKGLLAINPGNKLAKEQIAVASQNIKEMRKREKSMYKMMFQKKPEVLNVWKQKPEMEASDEAAHEDGTCINTATEQDEQTENCSESVAEMPQPEQAESTENCSESIAEISQPEQAESTENCSEITAETSMTVTEDS